MSSLVNSAVNMTLPANAAENRAAAPLLLSADVRRCRSIYMSRLQGSQQQTRSAAAV